ncbi:hypothetical protein M9980_03260 [Sphingomonas donggukensis]|uniref:Uncharacterized protein n=1 Tax=Sphingomonas donggukensis TaxID=2949093 RepID=A0ABY4TV36_9SPHN|nr:hypothetical protein [Sphingomonas donggukensis]URW76259.1 hypothetical protein M9980_03260 [Sphingomonas donggukensis]
MRFGGGAAALAVVAMVAAEVPATAQQAASGTTYLADSGSPFGAPGEVGDAASVTMPELAFKGDGTEAANFDKYYAFHRADTDFSTAFADISECDGYARGLQSGIGYMQTPYPYAGTLGGAIGGALGNAMAVMIFGSAEKRRLRRVNMRTCMNFKGYDRYGLTKDVWDKFNFEEGLSGVDADKRRAFLKQQALVAASGNLQGKALGL